MVDLPHKITIPPQPASLTARPRLSTIVARIAEHRVVLLTAPAGYGKTSLLIEWAHITTMPTAWYGLDRYDADPQTFVQYLAGALLRACGGALSRTAALLEQPVANNYQAALATVAREVVAFGQDVALILDDWHLVDGVPVVAQLLADLLRRAPNCHLIVASRVHPSIPDMMLRIARGEAAGVAEQLLRFTPAEAADVLARQQLAHLSEADVARLTERARGWIAAIVLMARAPDLGPQSVWAGSEQHVYAFLAEQVFDGLDPQLQSFVCQTALLDNLNPEVCQIVLHRDDIAGLLATLTRQHLFVTEAAPGLLRYHPLFREFLLERYRRDRPAEFRVTARLVADNYAKQQHWAYAFDTYMLAGERQAAEAALVFGGEQLYAHGQLATLERCLSTLGVESLSAPLLCLSGRVRMDRGQTQEAAALADLAAARMTPADTFNVRLFQAQLARSTGRYEEAIVLVEQALQASAAADQGAALRLSANCHERLGRVDHAVELLTTALERERPRGDPGRLALLYHDLGICHEHAGRLHAAEQAYGRADGYWTALGNSGARALTRNSLGVVQHQLGQYAAAHTQLTEAAADAASAGLAKTQAVIAASLGDLYADLQLWERAAQLYQEARSYGGSAFLRDYVTVANIQLLVRQRQFAAASAALDQLDPLTRSRNAIDVKLLSSSVLAGQYRPVQALAAIRQARAEAQASGDLRSVARAGLREVQVIAQTAPDDPAPLLAALEGIAAKTEALGYDAFIIAEACQLTAALRRAATAGSTIAQNWLARQAELRHTAQTIAGVVIRPTLAIQTLGVDHMDLDGTALALGWLKAREVLVYLLAHPRGATSEELCEALWPDRPAEKARELLRTAIHRVRNVLPDQAITLLQRRTYRFDRSVVELEYDAERFLALTDPSSDDPETLVDAAHSYHGTFFPWSDSNWCADLRVRLEQRYTQTLRRAAGLYEQSGRTTEALGLYHQALNLDPLDEVASAGAMRCYLALGNRAAAIESYHKLRRRLDDDLGLLPEPSSEVARLYARIIHSA